MDFELKRLIKGTFFNHISHLEKSAPWGEAEVDCETLAIELGQWLRTNALKAEDGSNLKFFMIYGPNHVAVAIYDSHAKMYNVADPGLHIPTLIVCDCSDIKVPLGCLLPVALIVSNSVTVAPDSNFFILTLLPICRAQEQQPAKSSIMMPRGCSSL